MTELIIERKSQELLKKIREARPNLNIIGTSYYVSNEGDDNADGLSPETAWKTIERVNQNFDNYQKGDAVLFRSGDTFRGTVRVRPITYSSYGEGEKPKIYASPFDAAKIEWNYEGDNVYSFDFGPPKGLDLTVWADKQKYLSFDIGNIVLNHGNAGCGYKKWENIGTALEFDLDFYHDLDNAKLYFKSLYGAPNERFESIELSVNRPVFTGAAPHCNGTVVDGFVIKYSGSCSINFSGFVDGGIVRNCELEWIGGSQMSLDFKVLFGNGYQVWGTCKDILIENCYFNQTYDAAVTPQWFGANGQKPSTENFVVRGCLFERNTYDLEYFITQHTSETDRTHFPDTKVMFKNIFFEDNICRLNGYGFGSRRTDRTTPSCIKSWKHQNKAENFIIRNNIFDRADYLLIEACADNDEWLPKFKNNVYCQYRGKGLYDVNGRQLFGDDLRKEKKLDIDKSGVLIESHRTICNDNTH